MSADDNREAIRGYIALVTGSLSGLDSETLAALAGDIATEGSSMRLPQLLGVAVGMASDLIHELAIATGQTEEEILQKYAARVAD